MADQPAATAEPAQQVRDTVNRQQLAAICRVLGFRPDDVERIVATGERVEVHTVDRATGQRFALTYTVIR